MSLIHILGAQGSRSNHAFTTCLQLSAETLIDAGNIMHALNDEAVHINHIFFSHAHLDHIIDTAFMIDNFFAKRTQTLMLYGLPETIQTLQEHFFNNTVWPDFSKINLPHTQTPAITYVTLEPDKRYMIEDGITLTPFLANHTVACCGYLIEQHGSAILFSGDTYTNPKLWDMLNTNSAIKALIIDVSFPNQLKKIAHDSKHLTASLLALELQALKRDDLIIYVNHLKPLYAEQIARELESVGISKEMILKDGASIEIQTGFIYYSKPMDANIRVQKLTQIGIALSSSETLDALLELIVTEAKNLTHADGGTLYLLEENSLRFKVVQTDSLKIKMGGTSQEMTWPALPLYQEDNTPNKALVAATAVLEDRLINIPDVYEAVGFSFEGTKRFDQSTGYRSKSMLVIPLKNHEHEIIGVLQLINKQKNNDVEPFDKHDENITLSLASQAAIAITNTSLIQGLESLLESFLRSIIYAISKKSPYTAGHIERMVDLTLMIAQAIDQDTHTFLEKRFTPEELKQINFAALMHDIGKLATPEQVVDKATKLEALFDRIALIETRFEVIKKALYIATLEQKISSEEYHEKEALLDSYFRLIQQSNTGSAFTNDHDVSVIQRMAQEPWIIDGVSYTLLSENEAYNLSVQRGTLTKEERDIINEHAIISVDILNKLPFPKKYKEIPQISGNHHEKINGKGYPQGLKENEISFEARILAIADIFEALTASDRPYKKGNSISQAMKILYFMAKDHELDPALVKFFYESNVYQAYAQKYLPKEALDEVTVDFSSLV